MAFVDPKAELADEVEIGAFAVVEADVTIGEGTILRPHAVVRRYTTLGKGNLVDCHAVLGGEPQDKKFDPSTVSFVRIGDNNIFREGVTVHRATAPGGETIVGNGTYWMANSHAGHETVVEDNVVLVNGALIAGHSTIGAGAILPANGAVHQYVWIGEGVMFQGGTMVGMHVPPYVIVSGLNNISGLNSIGLRRNPNLTAEDREQIKQAFKITYRTNRPPRESLEDMDAHGEWGEAAGKFREFVRKVVASEPPFQRGLCPHLSRMSMRHGS
jgi:UDP-N-acetylglucosamine acyltransferase